MQMIYRKKILSSFEYIIVIFKNPKDRSKQKGGIKTHTMINT